MELAAELDDAGTRSADAVARLWRAGELSAKKDGIGVYKVPLCLAVSGQHGLANNALDEIVASLQRSPGVFAPPPLPDGVVSPDKVTNLLSEYRTYFDAVILAGACATQRWDIVSDAAIAELLVRLANDVLPRGLISYNRRLPACDEPAVGPAAADNGAVPLGLSVRGDAHARPWYRPLLVRDRRAGQAC